jgi:hypothetical protein
MRLSRRSPTSHLRIHGGRCIGREAFPLCAPDILSSVHKRTRPRLYGSWLCVGPVFLPRLHGRLCDPSPRPNNGTVITDSYRRLERAFRYLRRCTRAAAAQGLHTSLLAAPPCPCYFYIWSRFGQSHAKLPMTTKG